MTKEQFIKYQTTLLELAKINNSELDSSLKIITEVDSNTLGIERVSVCLFNEDHSEIVCKDLYKMSEDTHEKGLRLKSRDYPGFFQALEEGRILSVNNTCTDCRTSECMGGYLKPFRITSLMDVPIRHHGKIVGIVCHEHTGKMRRWTAEEQNFAVSIADIASLALESSERKRAVEELERSLSFQLATLDSTTDGILVVDREGKIVSFNRKFVEMWRIPASIITLRDNNRALEFVLDQLKNPEGFLIKMRESYSQPDGESCETVELKDGRTFERYSKPQRIGETTVGSVWSFRDVAERNFVGGEDLRILNTIMEAVHKSSDLKEVLNIAIDKVMELTDIDIVGIYLVDEATNEAILEAYRGYPDQYLEKAGRIPYLRGVTWRVINSGVVYVVQDVSTDPYVGPVGKESGFKSFLSVPIKIGERTIGVFHFHSNKRNKFGRREIEFFTSIGTQIALAVAKAKKTKDLELINEDLSALNLIATSVHKSLDLKEVLNIALDKVVGITAFDLIAIYLVDEDINEAVLQAHRGLTDDFVSRAGRIPYPKGITWMFINSGEFTFIEDAQEDPDLGAAGRVLGHHAVVAVPIKQEDRATGVVIFASRRVLELSSRDMNLLNAIGSQIGIAIVQASLYEKSQKQTEELRGLYEDLDKRSRDLGIINTINQAVHKSLDLQEIYSIALDSVTELENVDMAMIYLVDENTNEAVIQAYRNVPEDYLKRASRIPYPRGITWKLINTGLVTNIEDVQKDPDIGPAGRDLGHHSILGIPILQNGKSIGVIWFLSYKERKFDEREVNLLSSLGTQIAISIAKANLYRELTKKKRYEEIISAVAKSVHQSINLQEVLENAVESMSKNIDRADNVSLYLVEREDIGDLRGVEAVLMAYRGYTDRNVDRIRRIPYPKDFTWKTIIGGKPRYCADIDQDTIIGRAGRDIGTKSYVSMPIHFEGKSVGCINVNSLQKSAFDEEELRLLEIVAKQIEVAINNARQAEVLRDSKERYRVLYEENPAMYFTVNGEGKILSVNQFGAEQLGYTVEELIGHSMRVVFHPNDRRAIRQMLTKCLKNPGKNYRCIIRKVKKDESVLWVRETARAVADADGNKVVLIVCEDVSDRMQAEKKMKQYSSRLRSLSRNLMDIQETERHHIAHELHDEIGQVLTAVKINLQAMQGLGKDLRYKSRLEESVLIIDRALDQVRNLSLDLRPSMLDDLGLVATLRWYLNRHSQRAGLAAKLVVDPPQMRLPAYLETVCFRIIQEALTNIVRHARAKNVQIELRQHDKVLELVIHDDGVGFSLRAVKKRAMRGVGFGLLGMQERTLLVGGEMKIKSTPTKGTTISARLPITSSLPKETRKGKT